MNSKRIQDILVDLIFLELELAVVAVASMLGARVALWLLDSTQGPRAPAKKRPSHTRAECQK
jgi:Ni2+-binding GTPase involved in maturation of urease and hydrogenase